MKKILLAACISVVFTACKNSGDPQPSPPDQNQKHLLVASVITDYGDGTNQSDYEYDDKNRVIAIHSSKTGNVYGDVADHVYTYDNNGNLTKTTITRGNVITVFDYEYTNGVPKKVTYSQPGDPSQAFTIDVTTANNAVTHNTIHTPSGISNTIDYSYDRNNKVKEVNKSLDAGSTIFTLTFDDEYGTKTSPFKYGCYKWLLPEVPYADSNELIKNTANNNGSITVDTYKYTYNDQGYPEKAQLSSFYNGAAHNITIAYKYINAK